MYDRSEFPELVIKVPLGGRFFIYFFVNIRKTENNCFHLTLSVIVGNERKRDIEIV